jgi:hypothetical protein
VIEINYGKSNTTIQDADNIMSVINRLLIGVGCENYEFEWRWRGFELAELHEVGEGGCLNYVAY